MSLNDIHLDPRQLGDWYGQQLVSPPTPGATTETRPWSLLGGFGKKVLILIDDPAQAFLAEEDLSFLTGILSACQLNLAEVGILNLNQVTGSIAESLQQTYHPSAWWLFGPDPVQLGLTESIQHLGPSRYQGAPVFVTRSLRDLSQQPEDKKVLWKQLKAHYGV
jgi:DNA polymerase III psi subunit